MTSSVADRWARVRRALSEVDESTPLLVARWLAEREDPAPGAPPEEIRAGAALDRLAARDLDPDGRRHLLTAARGRVAAFDPALTEQLDAEIALAEVRAGDPGGAERARACARRLEQSGALFEAAETWRSLAWFGAAPGTEDAAQASMNAANLAARSHEPLRCALSLVETAMHLALIDAERAISLVGEARDLAPEHGLIQAMADDTLARVATAQGRLDVAADLLSSSAGRSTTPVPVRLGHALDLCAALLAHSDWPRLHVAARTLRADAHQTQSASAAHFADAYLGLAAAHLGHPDQARALLSPVVPELAALGAPLVAVSGAVLGDLCAAQADWAGASTAYELAAASALGQENVPFALQCLLGAAEHAMLAEDGERARSLYGAATEAAVELGDVMSWLQAARGEVLALVDPQDPARAVAELDAVPERARATFSESAQEGLDWEAMTLEGVGHGAHVLAVSGRLEEALARLEDAETAAFSQGRDVDGWLLRAERGALLADADSLGEAEPVLRPALRELSTRGRADAAANTAAALAEALERAQRDHEAASLRQRYCAQE